MAAELHAQTVTIPLERGWPTVITPPPDRRHRWMLTREDDPNKTHAKRWFTCTACGRRRGVGSLVQLLGQRMTDAERSVEDYLNIHLWGRGRG